MFHVNSSSCAMGNKTTEIRVKYENILSHDINELVNISAEYRDRCCKNKKHENSKVFFCNDTQEIESLQSMACNMLRFFNKRKISKDFRWKAALVSCGTLQVLQCKCETLKKENVIPGESCSSVEVALPGIFAFYMHPSSHSAHLHERFMPEFWWQAAVPCSWRWSKQKWLNQAAEVQEVEIKDQRLKQRTLQKSVSHLHALETTLNFLIFE
ncbi:interleukin-7 isoform 2-T2 [Porphyrio hochstetteri]